jgi:hypothetical protein
MERIQDRMPNGWAINFTRNVHMYTHSLKAEKSGEIYDIPCEDTPYGFVAIWPYSLNLGDAVLKDLLQGLREWAEQMGIPYRLYRTRNDYHTNVKVPTPSRI